MLIKVLKDWKLTDLIVVEVVYQLVAHVRIDIALYLIKHGMNLVWLAEDVDVAQDARLGLHRDLMNLHTEVYVVVCVLKLSLLVLHSLDFRRDITAHEDYENCTK